jgi:hypothetical protein
LLPEASERWGHDICDTQRNRASRVCFMPFHLWYTKKRG